MQLILILRQIFENKQYNIVFYFTSVNLNKKKQKNILLTLQQREEVFQLIKNGINQVTNGFLKEFEFK